jgi:hypothetical protein
VVFQIDEHKTEKYIQCGEIRASTVCRIHEKKILAVGTGAGGKKYLSGTIPGTLARI